MNDVQSTIVGLKAQDCPTGDWIGMPDLRRATVEDCLTLGGCCGCIYGDAVQHLERLRAERDDYQGVADDLAQICKIKDAEIEQLQRMVDLVMAHDSNLIDHLERKEQNWNTQS